MAESETHNKFDGTAEFVVQAGSISGGVHHHQHAATAPVVVVPRQLPAAVPHFTDREQQIAVLDSWLSSSADEGAHVNVIAGVGGVGKTSLAAHWAHQVRDEHFPDGDLFVDLRGYHPEHSVDADEALDRLLRALDVPGDRMPVEPEAKAALFRSRVHGKRMLLVLDNAATVDQVRPLLPGAPTCRTLVTSRSSLPGLIARDGARRIELSTFSLDRAIELVGRIVGDERVRAEAEAAVELVGYCGSLPLALCIAAERLASNPRHGIAELVEELAEERERLDALSVDGDDFTTVRVVFSWSYRTLPADQARMFRLLALPAGPDITAVAAAVLFGTTEPKARRLPDGLAGVHLVDEYESGRYRQHDLLRVYAAERADLDEPAEERRQALRRLFTWYAHTVADSAQVIAPGFSSITVTLAEPFRAAETFPDRLAALRWCDAELDNLVAAVERAAEVGEHELAWQLPVTMFGYFLARRPFAAWTDTHEIAIASARRVGAREAEVWLLTSSAIAYRYLRHYDEAISRLRTAIEGWAALGVLWAEAWALRDLGGVLRDVDRDEESVAALERALAMHVSVNDVWGESVALSALASLYRKLGRPEDALRCLARSLEIRQAENDQRNVALVLNEYGSLYLATGYMTDAASSFEQALVIHRELDNWHGEAEARQQLGEIHARRGRKTEAAEHWRAAAELYLRIGDPRAQDVRMRLAELGTA